MGSIERGRFALKDSHESLFIDKAILNASI
jgi:hypothetical protein